MPAGQPFTAWCRALSRAPSFGRADLHLHTTFSDGLYTPAQILDLARRSGLVAVAVTDHDTLDGIPSAQAAARGTAVEVVPGVEITAEYAGREIHLLGYFVRLDDGPLQAALRRLQSFRAERYREMIDRLRAGGLDLSDQEPPPNAVLGRRHLAALLVKARYAATPREAFHRFLHDGGRIAVPKQRLPAAEALALVAGAGGVAAWAHPSYDCHRQSLRCLRDLGLRAVEVEYPGFPTSRIRDLRGLAAELGLAVSGGSDCHGPEPLQRAVGACTVTADDLERLRYLSRSRRGESPQGT